jgi:formate-dependent nitrite reductase membrane component NrfD
VREAMLYLISGKYAPWFWVVFVFGGMVLPLMLETLESLKKVKFSPIVPILVLLGSITLRFVIVFAGQEYPTFA